MIAYLGFVFAKAALRLLQALSPAVVVRLARILGWFAWHWDVAHRRIALRNLDIAFEDEWDLADRTRIARDGFFRLAENAFLAAWMTSRSDSELKEMFEICGVEKNLMPALAQKRGVIHVLFHLGNWEGLTRMISLIPDVKFSAIYQPFRNPYFDRLIFQWRCRAGLNLINRRNGLAEVMARLRRGEAIGMLVDQHAGDHGMWVPFFGRLASTTPLPALLARRTGATIIPIFCFDAIKTQRSALGAQRSFTPRWRIEFAPPIPSKERSDGEIMMDIHAHLEVAVRRDPAGWFWAHERWKTPSPNFLLRTYRRGVYVPPGCKLKPFRLLVRGANWLGDSILTIPALRAIRQGRPDCHLTLLTSPQLADLWKDQSWVDEVITSLDDARHRQFDAAILFPNSLRSALEAWRLGISRRQGYAGHHRRWLLTAICPETFRAGLRRHDVHDFLGLAKWSGAKIETEIPKLEISTSSLPRHSALGAQRAYVVLHPGAAHGSAKRWLPERFVELVRRFPDMRWKLIGSVDESDRNARLAAAMDERVENETGRLGLRELVQTLHGAAAVVCNDSGPMHLAAAMGGRVVAIFGSTEPLHTGPLGPGHRVIRRFVECSPCYLKECPIDLRCMTAVTVDEVENVLREVLRKLGDMS